MPHTTEVVARRKIELGRLADVDPRDARPQTSRENLAGEFPH
jgi:hypothetical protein